MSDVQQSSYVDEAFYLLLPQYKQSPVIWGILKSFAEELDKLSNELFAVKECKNLDTANIEELKIIAKEYNVTVVSTMSESALRRAILTQMSLYRATGAVNNIIDLLSGLTKTGVSVRQIFPKSLHIYLDAEVSNSNGTIPIPSFVDKIIPAGTSYTLYDASTTSINFTFGEVVGGVVIGGTLIPDVGSTDIPATRLRSVLFNNF